MDISKYFDEVNKKVDNISDEEFMQLLINSGLDKCPPRKIVKVKSKINKIYRTDNKID